MANALHRILVFHIGNLGDTLMIIPSLRALRTNFPEATFTLLNDQVLGNGFVLGASLFEGTNFFEQFITFPKTKGQWHKNWSPFFMLKAGWKIRRQKFDAIAYLVPSMRWPGQIQRDKRFFRLLGIRKFFGFNGFNAEGQKFTNANTFWQHEAEAILSRLSKDGLVVPDAGQADMHLGVTENDIKNVDLFFADKGSQHQGSIKIGFGPGTKMSAKKWPLERFLQVGQALISDFDICPVVFGGPEDRAKGNELLSSWGRGYNAAGILSLRESAEGLSRCSLYIGNDTGTMHLAAAVSTPCIAIFSARDLKGKWYPYGNDHVVFRKTIDCAGCKLETCGHKTCLMDISTTDVILAAKSRLMSKTY